MPYRQILWPGLSALEADTLKNFQDLLEDSASRRRTFCLPYLFCFLLSSQYCLPTHWLIKDAPPPHVFFIFGQGLPLAEFSFTQNGRKISRSTFSLFSKCLVHCSWLFNTNWIQISTESFILFTKNNGQGFKVIIFSSRQDLLGRKNMGRVIIR